MSNKQRNAIITTDLKTRKNKKQEKKQRLSDEKQLELQLVRSYPRQIVWEVKLPSLPAVVQTTVTTGLIAALYTVSTADIQAFATRFGSTFVEYRIIRAVVKMANFSSTNPGVVQSWYDEQSNATPTLAEAQERYINSINASDVDRITSLKWTAADPLDLQYRPIGTAYTPVTFKMFSNNANFGSSIVATPYFEVSGSFTFQFRGLLGV